MHPAERLTARFTARFTDEWNQIVAAPDPAWRAMGNDLRARHQESWRAYHGVQHVLAVIDALQELSVDLDTKPSTAHMLAAFFHDAIYDPTATGGVNEQASARLAEETLADAVAAGQLRPQTLEDAAAMIRATAGHQLIPVPGADVFLDADLSILAAEPDIYRKYTQAIRREYAHLEDEAFRAGRAQVMTAFLERDQVYFSAPGRNRWETAARRNVAAEIAELSADV